MRELFILPLLLLTACEKDGAIEDTDVSIEEYDCGNPPPGLPTDDRIRTYESWFECEYGGYRPGTFSAGSWDRQYAGCEVDSETDQPTWSYTHTDAAGVQVLTLDYVMYEGFIARPSICTSVNCFWGATTDVDEVLELVYDFPYYVDYFLVDADYTATTEAGTFQTRLSRWHDADYVGDAYTVHTENYRAISNTDGLISERWSSIGGSVCSGGANLVEIRAP